MNISTEKVCEASSNLSSPIEDLDGYLYLVTQNGEVLKFKDGNMTVTLTNSIKLNSSQVDFNISGQLSGIAIDKAGSNMMNELSIKY